MTTNISEIGMFNRVYWPEGKLPLENCHWCGVVSEWYFDFGQKSYGIYAEEGINNINAEPYAPPRSAKKTAMKVFLCVLKVMTWFTIVIPIAMLVLKCLYRSENIIYIDSLDLKGTAEQTQKASERIIFEGKKRNISSLSLDAIVEELKETLSLLNDTQHNRVSDIRYKNYFNSLYNQYSRKCSSLSLLEILGEMFKLHALLVEDCSEQFKLIVGHLLEILADKKSQKELKIEEDTKLVAEKFSDAILTKKIEEFSKKIDDLKLDSDEVFMAISNFIKEHSMFSMHLESIRKKIEPSVSELNPHLEASQQAIAELLVKLKEKFPTALLLPYFIALQEKLQNSPDSTLVASDATIQKYLVAVNTIKTLNGGPSVDNTYFYDQTLFQKIISVLKPKGIRNIGNSCYLNSLLQSLLAIPYFNQILNVEQWQATRQLCLIDEQPPEEDRKALENSEQIRLQMVKFIEARETQQTAKINGAAKKLRDALHNAGLIEGAKSSQQDPIRIINELLTQAGFGITSRNYKVYGAGENSRVRTLPEATEAMLTISLKDQGADVVYSHNFQGLIDHEFSEREVHEEAHVWEHDGVQEIFDDRKEYYKLTAPPEYFPLQLKRFGNRGEKIADNFNFDSGEVLDFSAAMPEDLIKAGGGKPFLYEPVAVIYHHGGSAGGGHYTADVKQAGHWFHCNDSHVTELPLVNTNLGSGYVYLFKRCN